MEDSFIDGLIPCPKCGQKPVIHRYSLQSPFEQVLKVSCPKHTKRFVSVQSWGDLNMQMEKVAADIWNNQKKDEPLKVFKKII